MTRLLALLALLLLPLRALPQCILPAGAPSIIGIPCPMISDLPGPSLDLQFAGAAALDSRIVFTRADCVPSSVCTTDASYTDAPGAAFHTFATNVPMLNALGFGVFEARTNSLLNSGAPVTQTTPSLATGTYVLFCNGTGTLTAAAVTAVGSGFTTITCSAGTFETLVVTVAGTVVVTVAGSVNWFDLQLGTFPTPHIVTAGAATTRAADVATLPVSFSNGSSATIVVAARVVAANQPTGGRLFEIDDGTANNQLTLIRGPTATLSARASAAGVSVTVATGLTLLDGVRFVGGVSYTAPVGYITAYNGILGATGPTAVVGTGLNTGRIGIDVGTPTTRPNAWIEYIRLWIRALSATELPGRTL